VFLDAVCYSDAPQILCLCLMLQRLRAKDWSQHTDAEPIAFEWQQPWQDNSIVTLNAQEAHEPESTSASARANHADGAANGANLTAFKLSCAAKAYVPKPARNGGCHVRATSVARKECRAACRPSDLILQ
jgi:hypothetical protein